MKEPLSISHPKIAKEFDLIKNTPLTADNVTHGSKKKVWWKCDKGHSYDQTIVARTTRNFRCSFCTHRRVSELNSLHSLDAKASKRFDLKKNFHSHQKL
jgi:hypothetical protein